MGKYLYMIGVKTKRLTILNLAQYRTQTPTYDTYRF